MDKQSPEKTERSYRVSAPLIGSTITLMMNQKNGALTEIQVGELIDPQGLYIEVEVKAVKKAIITFEDDKNNSNKASESDN